MKTRQAEDRIPRKAQSDVGKQSKRMPLERVPNLLCRSRKHPIYLWEQSKVMVGPMVSMVTLSLVLHILAGACEDKCNF